MQDFAAATTPATTQPTAAPVAPVRVVDRRGRVFEADTPDQAAALLEQRDPGTGAALFSLDTPEAAEERRLQREFGNREVVAGLAGAGRGATLGLSDLALTETGLVDPETLRQLQERNALASGLGELGGAVAPLLFSGGGSAVVRGGLEGAALAREASGGAGLLRGLMRGVTAPTRLVTTAAEAAEAGTLARLGTATAPTLGRRMLGRAASMGAGGAVEGAAVGVQQSITESVLGDAPLTAEQVMANVGLSALLGGLSGGALGTGAEALRTATRGSREVMARAFREATGMELRRGVAEAWEQGSRVVSEGAALATGADARVIREALSPDGADLRRMVSRGDELYDEATRTLTPLLDDVERGTRHAQDFWGRGMKPDQVRRLVSSERIGDQFRDAATRIARVRQLAESVIEDARAGSTFEAAGVAGRARELLRSTSAAEDMIGRVGSIGDPAEVSAQLFTALDEMKRGIGRVQDRIESVDRGSTFLQQLRGEDGYEGLRRTLEDADLWGAGAANAQRDVNQAYTRLLEHRRRYVREFLGHSERDVVDPFRELQQADSRNVDSFVRATGAARNDTRAQVFRDVLEAQAELMDTMGRHLDMGDVATEARTAAANARRARQVFDEVEDRVARVNQFRAIETGSGVERALVAQGAGFVMGGPLGAAIATALASPTTLARGLGAIERAAARVTQRIDGGVSSYVRRALDAARSGARRGAAAASRAGRKLAVRASTEEFHAEIERVIEAAAHPEETQQRIAESTRDVGEVAPSVQEAMQAQATRGVAFLVARIPPNARPSSSLMPGISRRREASTSERARFMRYSQAVNDPLSALDDLEAGSIPPESVEVLRELFPRLHAEIGNAFVRELASRVREGDEVPYTFRREMGALLGAATDPTLRPEAVLMYQQAANTSAASADAREQRQFGGPPQGRSLSALGRSNDNEINALARREMRRGG